ncbi:hypothetical protein F5890DRAFT_1554814 [Lentinula detonsa]|uniref:Uncharacterized protein n=1 Tax=Lentinula detonsa TaxID=2804962 RepID=A0AA38PXQ6_9AGAR|nr:hypothetical protein F5890DRAFT_1554814 [Lentinula detonsa]
MPFVHFVDHGRSFDHFLPLSSAIRNHLRRRNNVNTVAAGGSNPVAVVAPSLNDTDPLQVNEVGNQNGATREIYFTTLVIIMLCLLHYYNYLVIDQIITLNMEAHWAP